MPMGLFGRPENLLLPSILVSMIVTLADVNGSSAATNNQTGEGVAIKKVTNVFSKKILAKRALREIKLLQHFRGHRNVRSPVFRSSKTSKHICAESSHC